MKNINISSVKLIDNGTKGIEVKYLTHGVKENREYFHEDTSKRKAPIHKELEDCFSWLKEHLLIICGYGETNEEEFDLLKTFTDVTGITYGEKGFVISGKLSVLDRTKVIALNTPLITSDEDYEEFSAVCSICDGIYVETKEYMSGDKVMTDDQLILKFNRKNDDFDPESIKHMSKEEKRAAATKVLEDLGSIVIHNDELSDEEDEIAPVFTSKTEAFPEPVVEETAELLDEETLFDTEKLEEAEVHETDLSELAKLPESKPKKEKTKVAAIKSDDDDDFSLVPLLSKKK